MRWAHCGRQVLAVYVVLNIEEHNSTQKMADETARCPLHCVSEARKYRGSKIFQDLSSMQWSATT